MKYFRIYLHISRWFLRSSNFLQFFFDLKKKEKKKRKKILKLKSIVRTILPEECIGIVLDTLVT